MRRTEFGHLIAEVGMAIGFLVAVGGYVADLAKVT